MKNKILIYGIVAIGAYFVYKKYTESKRAEALKADDANSESTSSACGSCSNASGGCRCENGNNCVPVGAQSCAECCAGSSQSVRPAKRW